MPKLGACCLRLCCECLAGEIAASNPYFSLMAEILFPRMRKPTALNQVVGVDVVEYKPFTDKPDQQTEPLVNQLMYWRAQPHLVKSIDRKSTLHAGDQRL